MDVLQQNRRLAWFLPLRLAQFVILFGIVVLWMGYPGFLRWAFVTYCGLTLGFTLLVFLNDRVRLPLVTQTIVLLQIAVEIGIQTSIVNATGSIQSPFTGLFILTIVSAALAFRLRGTLIVATVVSTSYGMVVWWAVSDLFPGESFPAVLKSLVLTRDTAFNTLILHVLIFYLVAFMAGYLADRLRREKQALDDTSRQLRRARLETDDILRHLNSGLLTIDAQGHIIYYNRAAEKILGYPEKDVRGRLCTTVFADRMPELSQILLQALRGSQDRPRREIAIINPDGQSLPLGLSTSVLLEEQGEPRGVIAIFSDLTDAKAMEAKMRAADRLAAVGELSASIAHEIRNPLASISGSVEVLADDLQLEGTNAQLMRLIVKESHRLSKILSDFLEYARLGRRTYDKVDLVHLINEVIDLVRHHASYREDIFIDLASDESVVYVDGDADLYKQLLLNLALNACDALNGSRGQIIFTVVVHAGSDAVELYVQDTGPGMPAETLDRIFEPFFSTKKQGTGLGLAIVHRICALMGLELNVDSRQGQGTTFMVEFHRYHDHSPSVGQSQQVERPVAG